MASLGLLKHFRTPPSCEKLADLHSTQRGAICENLLGPHMGIHPRTHTHRKNMAAFTSRCEHSTFQAYIPWASQTHKKRKRKVNQESCRRIYTTPKMKPADDPHISTSKLIQFWQILQPCIQACFAPHPRLKDGVGGLAWAPWIYIYIYMYIYMHI